MGPKLQPQSLSANSLISLSSNSSSSLGSLSYVSGSRKRDLMAQIKKIELFMLIKRYNLSQLSAKILEGKTFDTQRNWQLNWALFSKAIELEIEKT